MQGAWEPQEDPAFCSLASTVCAFRFLGRGLGDGLTQKKIWEEYWKPQGSLSYVALGGFTGSSEVGNGKYWYQAYRLNAGVPYFENSDGSLFLYMQEGKWCISQILGEV